MRSAPEPSGRRIAYTDDSVSLPSGFASDTWLALIEIDPHLSDDAKNSAELIAANAVGLLSLWIGEEIAEALGCDFSGTWKVLENAPSGEEWLATTGGLGRVIDAEGELIENGWLRPTRGSAAWTLTKGRN